MHHFLHFDYTMRLTPFDVLEYKWLNSQIFMSYMDIRTQVNFNGSMDANSSKEKEENGYFTFLGGWSSHSTFLGGQLNLSNFLGG